MQIKEHICKEYDEYVWIITIIITTIKTTIIITTTTIKYIYIYVWYMIYIYVYICKYIPNKDISPNISQDVQWIQRTYIIWWPCLLDWSRRSPLLFGGHVSIGMQHPECKTLATTATTILRPNSKCIIRVSNFKFPSLFGMMLFDHFCETCLVAHPTNRK